MERMNDEALVKTIYKTEVKGDGVRGRQLASWKSWKWVCQGIYWKEDLGKCEVDEAY